MDQLPRLSFTGTIHLITTDAQLRAVAQTLGEATVLGFDTETRPSFKKGEVHKVALLQLSTETDAYLIRLHHVTEFEIIKKLFENSQITKVGVAIRDDLKLLQKLFSFVPENFIELQDVAKEKGLKNFGLKGMAEEVMGATLTKGPKMTNWELSPLSEKQLLYATTNT